MTRATWKGYLTIGQLGVPIRLYAATQSSRPQFVLLHAADQAPVERVLRCSREKRDIAADEVVRAAAYGDRYIVLTPHELEQTAQSSAKEVRVTQFADPARIPPFYFEKSYYIVAGRGGERAYALIREVFARMHVAAITQYLLHGREHIGSISVQGDMLLLHQLRYAADIVPRSSIKTPPLPAPTPAEVEALRSVIQHFDSPFYIEDYHNEYNERVHELIERKAKGLGAPRRERLAPQATSEDDILATLRDMLQRNPSGRLPEQSHMALH